jgi:hypothetical protein
VRLVLPELSDKLELQVAKGQPDLALQGQSVYRERLEVKVLLV